MTTFELPTREKGSSRYFNKIKSCLKTCIKRRVGWNSWTVEVVGNKLRRQKGINSFVEFMGKSLMLFNGERKEIEKTRRDIG